MSRTVAPKQSRKSAGSTKPLPLSSVKSLFDCDLAQWPAEIATGQTYTFTLDGNREQFYQRLHRAARRWGVEIDVRAIGRDGMFRVSGNPTRR